LLRTLGSIAFKTASLSRDDNFFISAWRSTNGNFRQSLDASDIIETLKFILTCFRLADLLPKAENDKFERHGRNVPREAAMRFVALVRGFPMTTGQRLLRAAMLTAALFSAQASRGQDAASWDGTWNGTLGKNHPWPLEVDPLRGTTDRRN
jgi:hypothetical protein